MAKKAEAVEDVWLVCSECGEQNYRTPVNVRGGMPEKIKGGMKKYCSRERRHTLHKIKRK